MILRVARTQGAWRRDWLRPLILAAILVLCSALCTSVVALDLAEVDALIEAQLRLWHAPGLSVAVVQDGRLLFAKGYGVRGLTDRRPVTGKTLFAIGSVTKSFTVATLALLKEAGRLDWDRPIGEYLPDFRLQDPVASEQMTALDLITHRSGLPAHDEMWYGSPYSRTEIYQKLRYLEPNKPFRSTFQYQNHMFVVAGYLAGQLEGHSWEESVRRQLFAPLKMENACLSVAEVLRTADHALPHQLNEHGDRAEQIPFYSNDAMGPAGGIFASAEEMAHWLLMHLHQGRFDNRQVLPEAAVAEFQIPRIVEPDNTLSFPEVGDIQYGMGWYIRQYRGHKLVSHGGDINGFTAQLAFVPTKNLGVVVLTNLNESYLPIALTYALLDRLLGVSPADWSSRFQQLDAEDAEEHQQKQAERERRRRAGTAPSHALAEYVGIYDHPAYGPVEISVDNKILTMQWHGFRLPLRHYHYDIFQTVEDRPNQVPAMLVQFHMNRDGQITRLTVPMEPAVQDIAFIRLLPEHHPGHKLVSSPTAR